MLQLNVIVMVAQAGVSVLLCYIVLKTADSLLSHYEQRLLRFKQQFTYDVILHIHIMFTATQCTDTHWSRL